MASESEMGDRLREILKTSDLNTTSAKAVRRQLEADMGLDLSDKKELINQLINDILQPHQNENANGDEEEEANQPDDEEEVANEEEEEEAEAEAESGGSDDNNESPPAKKRKGTGFTRVCGLSPQLQDLLGVPEMARTEVVKKLWAYIREKDLQVPTNKRNIKCDDKLRSIFRVDTINMFQMNKVLSKHIWPLDTHHECSVSSPRPEKKKKNKKPHKEDDDTPTDVERPKRKAKQQKGTSSTSGLLIPLQLSDAFVNFLGTGETTLSRSQAVKRIWDYIKQNGLQDPSDKRYILSDEKLKELFEEDRFHGFSITKYLTAHLSKVEQ